VLCCAAAELVALVSIYDAVIATAGVWSFEDGLPRLADFPNLQIFSVVVVATCTCSVIARLLYQRALSIAPLSLTVPYLAFTPAFVVLMSPVFLVGEVPKPLGMLGVFIVSISGYLLGRVASSVPDDALLPSSPSKTKLPVKAPPWQRRNSWSGSNISSSGISSSGNLTSNVGSQQLMHLQQQQHLQPGGVLQPCPEPHKLHSASEAGSAVDGCGDLGHSSRADKHTSAWAVAYYKSKAAHPAAAKDSPPAPVQLVASALAGGGNLVHGVTINPVNSSSSSKTAAILDGNNGTWADSRTKHKEGRPLMALTKGHSSKAAAAAAARASWVLHGVYPGSSCGWSLWQKVQVLQVFLSGPSAGPAMVLTAAALYSLTASLDKLGIAGAPNIWMYFLWQRLLIGAGGLLYLVCWSRGSIRYLVTAAPLLLSISVVELAAVVFYFNAIQNLLVSYVVAIKRVNVLLSTLIGCVLFGEHVGRRIPYILVMLGGMLLIVLQPGHEDLHHSHHTRRLMVPLGPHHALL